jgi:hypothetical protein
MFQIGQQHSRSTKDRCRPWDEQRANSQLARNGGGMNRPGASGNHERALAGIMAFADGN